MDRYDISKINGFYLKVAAGVNRGYGLSGMYLGKDWKDTIWDVSPEAVKVMEDYIDKDGWCDPLLMFDSAGARHVGWEHEHGWTNQPQVLTCPYMVNKKGNRIYPVKDGKIVNGEDDLWKEVFFSIGLIVRPKDW